MHFHLYPTPPRTHPHTHTDTRTPRSLFSEQDAVLEGTRDPVDDQASVVAERGKEPGVGRRPLGGVHAVLVLLVGGHHAVLQRLLTPAKKKSVLESVDIIYYMI